DFVDTDLLQTKPDGINYNEFWAFSKLLVIKNLVNSTEPFTIIDTDLWIHSPLKISNTLDVIMYHKEDYDEEFPKNIYTDFLEFIPDSVKYLNLDKCILPTNCALLHIKSRGFIETWYNLCVDICKYNWTIQPTNGSTKMCFIEQWLLPMLLTKMGYNYGTFIPQTYLSHKIDIGGGLEWYPTIENSSEIQASEFRNIKHVWGLKKLFNNIYIKKIVTETTLKDMSDYDIIGNPHDKAYKQLISEFYVDRSQF
ncbi:MAG: hypothetical protein EB127_22595, partial [Alphaproteobacteria bacterium]|nr:hypothetical protein [Alphaproteobacteria bacterium]